MSTNPFEKMDVSGVFGGLGTQLLADDLVESFMKIPFISNACYTEAKDFLQRLVNPKYNPCSVVAGVATNEELLEFVDLSATNFVLAKKDTKLDVKDRYPSVLFECDGNIEVKQIHTADTVVLIGKKITITDAFISAYRVIIVGEVLVGLDKAKIHSNHVYVYDHQTSTNLNFTMALCSVIMDCMKLNIEFDVVTNENTVTVNLQDTITNLINSYVLYPQQKLAELTGSLNSGPKAFNELEMLKKIFSNKNHEELQQILTQNKEEVEENIVVNNIQPLVAREVIVETQGCDDTESSPVIVGEETLNKEKQE